MDLDLRKMRYFVAVAEQLNFGRAAQELHIAQPVLSRQIRALEQELKVELFERDKRATRLTPAGQALLDDARPLLADDLSLARWEELPDSLRASNLALAADIPNKLALVGLRLTRPGAGSRTSPPTSAFSRSGSCPA